MPDHRIPKRLLYGELQQGKGTKGGQRKRFRDILKSSLNAFNIDAEDWEALTQDRTTADPSPQKVLWFAKVTAR
jgi:hypothetical protein